MAVDLESEWWRDHKDGTLLKTFGTDHGFAGVPVEVTLQWRNSGWNRIVGVRIGSEITNQVQPTFKNGIAKPRETSKTDFRIEFEEIHPDLIQSLTRLAIEIQQDIEQTRAAVDLIRGEKLFSLVLSLRGKIAPKSSKHIDRNYEKENFWRLTYGLKNLLRDKGHEDYAELTGKLLGIGTSTVHKYYKEGERLMAQETKPKTQAKKRGNK